MINYYVWKQSETVEGDYFMLYPIFGLNFGKIPVYYLMLFIAFIVGRVVFGKIFPRREFSAYIHKRIRKSFYYGCFAGVVGAKIPDMLIAGIPSGMSPFESLCQSGNSFYFGMLFFFFAFVLCLRIYKIDYKYCTDNTVPVILFMQFFARLGCSLRGCCYGIEISVVDTAFHLPVREAEAVLALILAIVLLKFGERKKLKIYLFSYSLFRIVTDFLRGDTGEAFIGSLNITAVQFVSYFVTVITAAFLFVRPVCRVFSQEETLDSVNEDIRAFFGKIRSTVFPRLYPFAPLPRFYTEPYGKKHPAKAITAVVLVISVISVSLLYINPGDTSFGNSIQDFVDGYIFSVFAPSGSASETGNTNGITLFEDINKTKIENSSEAISLLVKNDTLKQFSYSTSEIKELADGNTLYVMSQTVKGKPVFGRTRVVVTDKNGNVSYIAGDENDLSLNEKTDTSHINTLGSANEIFGDSISVLRKEECLYDTGDGLCDAYYAVLTDDGETPVLGAVIKASDNTVICLADAETATTNNIEKKSVLTAVRDMISVIRSSEESSIKELSSLNINKLKDAEKKVYLIKKIIAAAYLSTGLSGDVFCDILSSSYETAKYIPTLNGDIFREILTKETLSALVNSGSDEDSAEKTASSVRKAFTSNGIDNTEDEKAFTVNITEKKSSKGAKIDFAGDSDTFMVSCEENCTTEIGIKTSDPVYLEVYSREGYNIVTMYIEESEELTLYAEDGNSFSLRVRDARAEAYSIGTPRYTLSFKATPDEIPNGIENTLSVIESSYEYSLLPLFYSVYAPSGDFGDFTEAIGAGIFSLINDSCAAECSGMGDSMDTVKSLMMSVLAPNYNSQPQLNYLKGTTLGFTYIHHVEKEGYTALKTLMAIKMNGMNVYSSYVFMRLENVDLTAMGLDPSVQKAMDFIENITGEAYQVTAVNSGYLYSDFGDSPGSVSSHSDITSLYELWEEDIIDVNGIPMPLMRLDAVRARLNGHSEEKIAGFEKYTARYNLMNLKAMRISLKVQLEVMLTVSELGEPVKALYDFITNPVGFVADQIFAQNETVNEVWHVAKYIIDPDGAFTDDIFAHIFSFSGSYADTLTIYVAVFDSMIIQYEEKYNSL